MGDRMVNALDSLANAAFLKTETCETLVSTNKKLTQELSRLASIIQTLTIQLRFNSGANNANIKGGGVGAGGGAIHGTGGPATNQPWDPHGYCWSHGFKVRIGHSSGTCNNRKTDNFETDTRTKTMGGVKWNSTWEPSERQSEPAGMGVDGTKVTNYKQNFANNTLPPPGCANPLKKDFTALVDTAANISLLTAKAPATDANLQLPTKTSHQSKT